MKIVGHRGAAGIELENTVPSIRTALEHGADAIEFDVRKTADGHLVVCHDADTSRISSEMVTINQVPLERLRAIRLHNGTTIPTLSEALEHLTQTGTRIIVEIKDTGCVNQLIDVLQKYPSDDIWVASFKRSELQELLRLKPDTKVYVAERLHAFDAIQKARAIGASGIDLNFWVLNPLVYWLARRGKLEIMVYTVNNVWFARFIHVFYPQVWICTNYPNYFNRHDKKSRRTT